MSSRPRISAALRALVWNTYIGEEKGIFRCMCGSTVSQLNFECGHIIPWSQKGTTTLPNLRPICSRCNRSMGTTNMFEYMKKLGVEPEDFYRQSNILAIPSSRWSILGYIGSGTS